MAHRGDGLAEGTPARVRDDGLGRGGTISLAATKHDAALECRADRTYERECNTKRYIPNRFMVNTFLSNISKYNTCAKYRRSGNNENFS
jgi:hypothetical protein